MDMIYGEQLINCQCFQLSISREEAQTNCQTYIDSRLLVQQGSRPGSRFKLDAVYCLTQKGAFAFLDVEGRKIGLSEELSNLHDFTLKTGIFYLEKTPNGKFSISFNLASIMFRNFVIELESETLENAKMGTPTIRERIFALKKRGKNAFLGSEVVDWMLDHCSVVNREEATQACATFSSLGWIAAASAEERAIKDGTTLFQITPQGLSVAETHAGQKDLISPENNEKFDNFVSTHVLLSEQVVSNSSSILTLEKKSRPVSMLVAEVINPTDSAKVDEKETTQPRSRGRSATVSNSNPATNMNSETVLKSFVIERSQSGQRKLSINVAELVSKETGGARLNQILLNPQLCEAFGEYLKGSYCYENLAFWMDTEEFRKKFQFHESVSTANTQDQSMLIPHAIAIYMKYIILDSPFEVNIGSNIKKEMQTLMEKAKDYFSFISTETLNNSDLIRIDEVLHGVSLSQFPLSLEGFSGNMFSLAHSHIFRLMATDSVPKFMKTPTFKTMVNVLKLDFFMENHKYITSDSRNSQTSFTRVSVAQPRSSTTQPRSNIDLQNQPPSEIQSPYSTDMKAEL
ncbi:hypothetical protein HK096_003259 [Nowakowskiella sp. JEL0078]|nr:hypothetical protein HK096_003259 [Nowakowskiella sp. JEL0078]